MDTLESFDLTLLDPSLEGTPFSSPQLELDGELLIPIDLERAANYDIHGAGCVIA